MFLRPEAWVDQPVHHVNEYLSADCIVGLHGSPHYDSMLVVRDHLSGYTFVQPLASKADAADRADLVDLAGKATGPVTRHWPSVMRSDIGRGHWLR